MTPDGRLRQERRTYLIYLIPCLGVVFLVTVVPLVFVFVTSFTPLDLTKPNTFRFSGINNYVRLVTNERFWNSVWVQARLSFWGVVSQAILGFGLALLLNRQARFQDFWRSIFMIPMVLPPIVVAIIWKILFTPNISIYYWLLEQVGLPQTAWLTDARLALPALIISDSWEWFPFVMLYMLAALQMLPEEPMEAARIDGASALQLFWYIKLPLLRPALAVAVLFRFIETVKAFPHIFVMTEGGPGTVTEATNYYTYLNAFSYSYIGLSSAIVVLMLIAVFCISLLIIRSVGKASYVE